MSKEIITRKSACSSPTLGLGKPRYGVPPQVLIGSSASLSLEML